MEGAGVSFFSTAVLLAHPEENGAYLEERLHGPLSDEEKKNVAVVLGMMGNPKVTPILADVIDKSEWDAGWNYRGMGQFGLSNSPLDALIVALGLTRPCQFEERLIRKVEELIRVGDQAVFSHCRAVAIAASLYKGSRLAAALESFLRLPGVSGHAVTSTLETIENPDSNRIEDTVRNRALRELYLAKVLCLCDDPNGLARELLTQYRSDLRCPPARHAAGILDAADTESLCSGY